MRYTDHGGGPADGALKSAVSAMPESSTPAGQPPSAHLAAIAATTVGSVTTLGDTLDDEIEAVCGDAQRAAPVARQVPALARRLPGLEPERAVHPQCTDTGQVRAAVVVDRGQPARVSIGAALARRLGDAGVETGSDDPPVDRRRAVEICEVLRFHAGSTVERTRPHRARRAPSIAGEGRRQWSVKPATAWVPSHNGLFAEAPQRHRVIRLRASNGSPSAALHRDAAGDEQRAVVDHADGRAELGLDVGAVEGAHRQRPEGQRAIIAIICERTIVSSIAGEIIFHTFVAWLPQNPACSQIERSSRTTIFVPRSYDLARSS